MEHNIVVVSDLHVGSIFGLMPPGFVSVSGAPEGNEVNLNIGQKYLWECWTDLCSRLKKMKVAALVFNGDCIDGKQRKSEGAGLCLNRCSDQAAAAAVVARTIQKACGFPKTYVIKGTPYHSGTAGDEEDRFAKEINAGRALRFLDLDIDGVVLNFLHGIGVGGGLYRATSMDREAMWSALAGKEGRAVKADCLIRSHAHYFLHLEFGSKHGVVNPCFQLQTDYALKSSQYRMLPEIGNTIIRVDPEAKRNGEDPIHVEKFLYKLPVPKATRLPL